MRYISEVTVRWTTQWTTHLSLSQSCDTHKLTKTSRRLTWVMHSCRSSSLDLIMYLFSLLGKTADWAIYFACVNFFLFFNWAKLSQDLLDLFSQFFHQMEGICVNIVNADQFFRFLKGHCHGNQFCSKITYPLHLSLWHSETEYDIATLMYALTA